MHMLLQRFSLKQFHTCNINIVISAKVTVIQSNLLGTRRTSQLVCKRRGTIGDTAFAILERMWGCG